MEDIEAEIQSYIDNETRVEDKAPIEVECDEESSAVEKQGKKRRFQSEVWNFFTMIEGRNPPRAACNFCKKDLAADVKRSGTSGLWNHHRHCEKNPNNLDVKNQTILGFEPKKEGDTDGRQLAVVHFDKEACRLAVAKYIVLDELSFRHVEHEGFRELVRVLEPRFTLPSRFTVARDIFQLYLDEKEKLKKVLKEERISITTDTWTSIQNINYMCITAHWVDSDWKLQKRIISFCQITDHKGETIGAELEGCINAWGIQKLFTITVDNASSNSTAIDYIREKYQLKKSALILDGEFLHLRCSAHIVNLIVTEGLKEKHRSISSIRNAIRYVRSSPSRLLKFKECVVKEGIECKGLLSLDVPTRWNSTYLMLEIALKFQTAFKRMEKDLNYMSYFDENDKDGPPTLVDWNNATIFVKFLKTFYDVTLKFSGSTYVTSNLYFLEICEIQSELQGLADDEENSMVFGNTATLMQKKYDKYWGSIEGTKAQLIIATVLDPRYKLEYVRHSFEMFHDVTESAKLVKKVESTFRKIFDHYNEHFFGGKRATNSEVASEPNDGDSSAASLSSQPGKVMSKFLSKRRNKDGGRLKNEVDKYLEEPCEEFYGARFDILEWWKLNAAKYNVLSAIARDVLAVPVTTVPSESAFSTGGRILDPFRSALSPTVVEGLICLKNWLSSNKQPIVIKEFMDEVEVFETSERLEEGIIIR